MPWHIVFLEDLCPFCLYQDILDSGIVSSASCSCWLSAAWCPESVSSEELPLAPTMHSSMSLSLSHSELESEAGWIFFWLSCTIEVKILLSICAFTTLTFSSLFPLNAIFWWLISSSSSPTLLDDNWFLWQRSSHSMSLYSCCFLSAHFLSFAQCNLQQAFLNQFIFRKLFDCPFIPCFELILVKHLFNLSSRLIIITFAATRRCFHTWWIVKVRKFPVNGIGSRS